MIPHWVGGQLLLANKCYLINTERDPAGLTYWFILAPTRCSWWDSEFGVSTLFCSCHSWTRSSQRDLSPGAITCDHRYVKEFWTAFLSDSWQHGDFYCTTEVNFVHLSPPKAAILMLLWPQIFFSTANKNDEQRLSLLKEDARQLLHPQTLVHWVRIQLCDCDADGQWMQHETCVNRCSGSIGSCLNLC